LFLRDIKYIVDRKACCKEKCKKQKDKEKL